MIYDPDCGGESPTHEKMKSIAADHLRKKLEKLGVLSDLHIDTRQIGDKTPDVLAELTPAQERFGEGIAIECQYRNKGKDYEETQNEYLDHGISTLWLEEDAFDLDNLTVNFSLGEWVHVWPNAVPHRFKWGRLSHFTVRQGGKFTIRTPASDTPVEEHSFNIDARVPATLHLERWERELEEIPSQTEWGYRVGKAGYSYGDSSLFPAGSEAPPTVRQSWRWSVDLDNGLPSYLSQGEPQTSVSASFPAEWWRDHLRDIHGHYHRLYRNRKRIKTFQEVIPHLQKDLEHYYDYHRPRQEIGNIQEGIELLRPPTSAVRIRPFRL